MKSLKIICISLIVIALSSCARFGAHDKASAKHAQTIPPLVIPAGAHPLKEQSYYTVPKTAKHPATTPVSLLPPGSHISEKSKHSGLHSNNQVAKWVRSSKGSSMLTLPMKANVAWSRVGKALHADHYQILDEDSAMGSYYVLDTRSTDKKITEKTPIYRLNIKQVGKHSEVTLMNQNNKPAKPAVAQRILGGLQKRLS